MRGEYLIGTNGQFCFAQTVFGTWNLCQRRRIKSEGLKDIWTTTWSGEFQVDMGQKKALGISVDDGVGKSVQRACFHVVLLCHYVSQSMWEDYFKGTEIDGGYAVGGYVY